MADSPTRDNAQQAAAVKWFALTGLFRHVYPHDIRIPKYEYRTTLCGARDRKSAEQTLLRECRDYAADGVEFLEEYEIFELDDPPGEQPIEVAHEMIISTADPEVFIKTHWCRDRVDFCEARGWNHVWYNQGGTHSACYNCREVREGRLWERAADHESEET